MTVTWKEISGALYATDLCQYGRTFFENPGVYIFCRPTHLLLNNWDAIYVGETENFDDRLNVNLTNHHQWANIKVKGATNVCCLHVPGDRSRRLAIEKDLRVALNPPCNRQ
jgi:hypothetical protein